jgi:integrase
MNKKIGLYKEETCKGTQWRCRWFGEYDPNKSKQKRYGKTFTFKKDAERFIKGKDTEFEQGAPRDPSTETLKEFAEQCLQDKTQNDNLRPATVLLYREMLDRLYKYFGENRLPREIDPRMAKSFLAVLKPLNPQKEKLSPWTRHRILRLCKTLFSEAVTDRIINNNPFKEIDKSGTKCIPSEWYYLQLDEYFKLLDATPKLNEKVLYALCYTGGLRLSEALSLRWSEVDFNKGRVSIVKQPETDILPPFEPKDKESRTVPLPEDTLNLLLQLHEQAPEKVLYVVLTRERYEKILAKWKECRKTNRPWRNSYFARNVLRNFRERLHRAEIKAGNNKLTIHTLRKACIQNWANDLPMNVVKEFAGHSSIVTTQRFYSKVTDEHFDQAAKAADKRLKEAQKKAGAETTDLFLTFSDVLERNQDASCPK